MSRARPHPCRSRRLRLAAAGALLLGSLSACAGHNNADVRPPQPQARLATWVWSAGTVLDPHARARMLDFLQRQGANTLYVQLSPRYEGGDFGALGELLAAAKRVGVQVRWVDGDPGWALPGQDRGALDALERARRINQRLEADGLPRIAGVLFDVEPYLRAEWKQRREHVLAGFDVLRVRARAASQAAGLELWWTLPFWFLERAGEQTKRLMEGSDGVVVMAYRDRPEQVAQLSRAWLAAAESSGKSIVIAIETGCIEPHYVSFCGASARRLEAALGQIRGQLASSPAFGGLAVHQYASWQTLAAAPGDP